MAAAKQRKLDWFLCGMGLAVLLAWIWPEPGARHGWLHPELITNLGVALIFFLHGLGLSFAALTAGILQWRLHLLVQLSVFLLFPVLGGVLYAVTSPWMSDDLRLGFFFLCALPSTVSSSVALTSAAQGNVPAAVFNATLSSLLGIVITPLWMSLVASTGDARTSIGGTIVKLCLWLLLPLLVGQILRPWWGAWVARHKRFVNTVDRLTILLLVYTSFCDSFVLGVWTRQGLQAVLLSLLLTGILFWIVFSLMVMLSRLARFVPADRTAVIFCGSKKSLATGVPMAQLMFNGNPALGVILLPIMIYHPLQLVICGFLAGRWGREAGHATDSLPELISRSEPAAMEESVSDSQSAPPGPGENSASSRKSSGSP